MQIKHNFFHLKLLLSLNSTRVAKKVCLARNNNHPTSLASSWDISFLRSLVQQDPKGSNKVAHLFILDVYVSPNRKYVNLSLIYYILDFSFFMSQDGAYFHIHQNDPIAQLILVPTTQPAVVCFFRPVYFVVQYISRPLLGKTKLMLDQDFIAC